MSKYSSKTPLDFAVGTNKTSVLLLLLEHNLETAKPTVLYMNNQTYTKV